MRGFFVGAETGASAGMAFCLRGCGIAQAKRKWDSAILQMVNVFLLKRVTIGYCTIQASNRGAA